MAEKVSPFGDSNIIAQDAVERDLLDLFQDPLTQTTPSMGLVADDGSGGNKFSLPPPTLGYLSTRNLGDHLQESRLPPHPSEDSSGNSSFLEGGKDMETTSESSQTSSADALPPHGSRASKQESLSSNSMSLRDRNTRRKTRAAAAAAAEANGSGSASQATTVPRGSMGVPASLSSTSSSLSSLSSSAVAATSTSSALAPSPLDVSASTLDHSSLHMLHQSAAASSASRLLLPSPSSSSHENLAAALPLGPATPTLVPFGVHNQRDMMSFGAAPFSMHVEGDPLHSTEPPATYDEKSLREAAAAEVAAKQAAEKAKQERLSGSKRKLSAEEKARQSRDRNREHARNTRLRKKAYVQKLTELVKDLTAQKERQQRDNALKLIRQRELESVRLAVLKTFMHYRATGEQDRHNWERIVDKKAVLTLPITPYRSFLREEVVSGSRVVTGLDGILADTKSLQVCLESIGAPSEEWKAARTRGTQVLVQYDILEGDAVLKDNLMMTRWTMRTLNAMQCGARDELHVFGMLRVRFTDQSRISSAEFVFDVMSFMQQLQSVNGAAPPIVPNTLEMARMPSSEARVITANAPGCPITSVNEAWSKLCGFSRTEVEGRSLSMIQGEQTDRRMLSSLVADSKEGQAGSLTVVNYKKDGTPFQNYLRIYPLSNGQQEPTHMLGVLQDVSPGDFNSLDGGHLAEFPGENPFLDP